MANQKRGRQSFVLAQPPVITAWANVAGKKEVEGPLAHTFDQVPGHLFRPENLGAGRKADAAAGSAEAGGKSRSDYGGF